MSWEWSHTNAAYEAARQNITDLDRETLEIVFAENQAADQYGENEEPEFSEVRYLAALMEAQRIPQDELVQAIWDSAEELRTCDNGGFNAWICPWGCHRVPFSRPNV